MADELLNQGIQLWWKANKMPGRPPTATQVSRAWERVGQDVVEEVAEPPPLSEDDAVRFWTYRGKHVIYEYKHGRRLKQVTYENEKGRAYYQEGDVILLSPVEKRTAEDLFPELKSADETTNALLWLVKMFLGWEEPKYTVGWRITRVVHIGGGRGRIYAQGVIVFGKEHPVPLETTSEFGREDLHFMFITSRQVEVWEAIIVPVSKLLAEIALIAVTGLARSIFKKLTKEALRTGLQKVLIKVFRAFAMAITKCVIAFVAAFAKDYQSRSSQGKLKLSLYTKETGKKPDDLELRPSIIAGAGAFATTLIKETLEAAMLKNLSKSLAAILDLGESALKDRIKAYVTKEVVKACTTEFMKTLTDGVAKAAAGADAGKGKFDELLLDNLREKLQSSFSEKIKEWSTEMIKELAP